MVGIGRKPFDGGDALGRLYGRYGCGARPHGLIVDMDGTSAAQRHATTEFGACEAYDITNHPKQGGIRVRFNLTLDAVNI